MGAWGHGLFENDGAADVLAAIRAAGKAPEKRRQAVEDALVAVDDFMARDARGETFRKVTEEEIAEIDASVREALADFPNLIAEWEAPGDEDEEDLLTDTGDHEAQGLLAAAVVVFTAAGVAFPAAAGKRLPAAGFVPDAALLERTRAALDAVLAHDRLLQDFPKQWVKAALGVAAATQVQG